MLQTRPAGLTVSHKLFVALCAENRDLRLERTRDGELIVMPPAGAATSSKNLEISVQLAIWRRAGGGGIAFDSSAGFKLPDGATRSPDASWIETSRLAKLTREERQTFAPICPDFVLELLSPSDSLRIVREKMAEYIENGARLGWLIDPFRKSVEIYRPDRDPEVRVKVTSVDGESVLVGFVLDLTPIFAD